MRHRLFGIEAWAGLVLLGLAILYWQQADALPRSSLGGSVGSAGMPKVLGVALGVMAILLIIQSIIASPAVRESKEADLPEKRDVFRAGGFWLIAAGFVFILPWVGYPVAVAAALLAIGFYYGRKPSIGFVAFAVIGAIGFYLLFEKALGVPLPLGIWPDLLS